MDQNGFSISPAVPAAFISFFGGVVCVPIFNRALTQYFDKRARISVSFSANTFEPSKYIVKMCGNYFDQSVPEYDRKVRLLLCHLRGYVKIEVVNEGSTAIKNMTLSLSNSSLTNAILQVDNIEETYLFDENTPFKIGDLQPKIKKVIHLYVNILDFGTMGGSITKCLHISADQIDRIRYFRGGPELAYFAKVMRTYQWANYIFGLLALLSTLSVAYQTYKMIWPRG